MHTPARSRWGRAAGSTSTVALRTASGSAAVYRPRNPTATVLYPIVQHHLETFLARAGEADPLGDGVPHWVENDFRAYLRCGILAHGFARARCDGCGSERLVAFSCKGRGVCPSCNARRMVHVAAHLTDHVLPPLPIRQWVLSLPKRLRPFLHRDPALAGAVLRIMLRAVRATLERACSGAPSTAQLGAVSFIQRFGGSLNPHFHFHVLVLDGLFTAADDGSLYFREAVQLTGEDTRHVERTVQRRVLRHFVRRGLLEDYAARDMLTWQVAGGFSIDASVCIPGHDRAGRERLIRYCARPPFALERLHTDLADRESSATQHRGAEDTTVRRVTYLLAAPAPDGRTALSLSPLEFLEALSRLIPPPRVHRQRYHGVLAPHARLRTQVTAWARDAARADAAASSHVKRDDSGSSPTSRSAASGLHNQTADVAPRHPPDSLGHLSAIRSQWARLLARIYEVWPLSCDKCGGELRIIAFLTEPGPVRSILVHLGLPSRAPTTSPARAPPQTSFDSELEAADLGMDQTPAFDPADPEPVPDYDFDQRPPGWD